MSLFMRSFCNCFLKNIFNKPHMQPYVTKTKGVSILQINKLQEQSRSRIEYHIRPLQQMLANIMPAIQFLADVVFPHLHQPKEGLEDNQDRMISYFRSLIAEYLWENIGQEFKSILRRQCTADDLNSVRGFLSSMTSQSK